MAFNITCPSCDTRYDVGDGFPAEGRRVRCAKCQEVWDATPVSAPEPPAVAAETAAADGEMSEADIEALMSGDAGGQMSENDIDALMSGDADGEMSEADIEALMSGDAGGEMSEADIEALMSGDADGDMSEADIEALMSGDAGGDMSEDDIDALMADDDDKATHTKEEWSEALSVEEKRKARIVEDDKEPAKPKRLVTINGPKKVSPIRIMQAFTVGLTLAGIFAAFTYKEQVVRTFPSTAMLFAAVGIEVNIRGLEIADLSYQREYDNGVPVLTVKGRVINISGRALVVPRLRLSLASEQTSELYSWTIKPVHDALQIGETMPFTARLAAPPMDARTVSVRFTDAMPQRQLGALQ